MGINGPAHKDHNSEESLYAILIYFSAIIRPADDPSSIIVGGFKKLVKCAFDNGGIDAHHADVQVGQCVDRKYAPPDKMKGRPHQHANRIPGRSLKPVNHSETSVHTKNIQMVGYQKRIIATRLGSKGSDHRLQWRTAKRILTLAKNIENSHSSSDSFAMYEVSRGQMRLQGNAR